MNKSKAIFTMIFCVMLLVGAIKVSAQTSGGSDSPRAVAAQMVEFYEWAFDTDFTAGETAAYIRVKEQNFRTDPAAELEERDSTIGNFARIKQADAEARREARRKFLEGFLPNLKNGESSNPEARLLLDIYRRSHNGKDYLTTMDAASGDPFDRRALGKAKNADGSPNVIGRWKRGTGSGYVHPDGQSQHRVSDEHTFEFMPDGTVNYLFESDLLTLTQCRTTETIRQSGRYSISGGTLTINLMAGTSVGTSSCGKSGNFKKAAPAASIKKSFSIERLDSPYRPSRPLMLCFDGQTGEGCFEKQ